MKRALLLLVGALLLVNGQYYAGSGGRCQPPNTLPCVRGCTPGDRPCPRGDLCCPNACRTDYTCGSPVNSRGVPRWCPARSPRLNCLENPCRVMRCPNFPQAVCINSACEPNCSGDFYLYSRRLTQGECYG